MIRALATALSLVALLASSASASARPRDCAPTGAWVLATVRPPPPPGIAVDDVLDRLEVELAMRGMALCIRAPASSREAPVATVELAAAPPVTPGQPAPPVPRRSAWIDVEVRDGDASKRASREVDLTTVARDKSATVVALAADELMRAAADELALERAQRPPPSAPPVPAPTTAERSPEGAGSLSPRMASKLGLGLRGAAELWTGGLTLLGGDVVISLRAAPRARLELDLGGRGALDEQASDGSIEARALTLRAGGGLLLTRPGAPLELSAVGRFGIYALHVSGDPHASAGADASTSAGLTFEAGPNLSIPLPGGASSLFLDVTAATAIRGVSARDGDAVVTGLTGFAFTSSLGFVTGVL